MIKKYLIRSIGALCILGVLALMFLPTWVELDGVDRGELRNLRNDISGICSEATSAFTDRIQQDEDFKDELKDYDLPYTRSSIRSEFKRVEKLSKELLNDTVSLKELLTLSLEVPGILKDMENLLDSDAASDLFFRSATYYAIYEGSQAMPDAEYTSNDVDSATDALCNAAEESMEMILEFSSTFPLLAAILILLIALGVLSAITHVCNKGRWVKYLFLVILVGLVIGSCVMFPLVSDMAADMLVDMPAFEDMELKMTVTPFIALILAIIPIVLDIIFERKKTKNIAEESTYGK